MGVGPRIKHTVVPGLLAVAMSAAGQTSVTLTEPNAPLLPASFGEWRPVAAAPVGEFSLANANKAALEECGPQRSAVGDYTRGGKSIHIEAIQFGDRTGAYSAFTLVARPGMKPGQALGTAEAVGQGAVLFQQGSTLVLANGTEDAASLKPLALVLPKVSGNKGIAPLLPTLVPEKGLVPGSVRYALGASSYAAEGGVLPAQSLGWDKSAEAVTALYDDARGHENLTVLLYPTPAIAGNFAKAIREFSAAKGGKVRREGELVMLAEGSFSPDEAQRMIENIHLKQELTIDRDVPPVFQVEVHKTYSLLTSIAVLSGVLMFAAVLLGAFLGGGRALVRVMRGKSAAVEPEFLSLHLDPQNAAPRFDASGSSDGS